MDIITRKQYAEKVDSWLGKEDIIVVVGQRRVGKSYTFTSTIVADTDEVARLREGVPRYVEPAPTREQLVGVGIRPEEAHELRKPGRVSRTDVGSLAQQVLRVIDPAHTAVHVRVAEP